MDAPLCRLCGAREWNHRCGVTPAQAALRERLRRVVAGVESGEKAAVPAKKRKAATRKGVKTGPKGPDGKFDRKAYQREYMRRRRREGKA